MVTQNSVVIRVYGIHSAVMRVNSNAHGVIDSNGRSGLMYLDDLIRTSRKYQSKTSESLLNSLRNNVRP